MLFCCNEKINDVNIWFLNDLKNFTARKIEWGQCPCCKVVSLNLIEKRIDDDKFFIDHQKGKQALDTLKRERKRIVEQFPHIQSDVFKGWVYGHNVQIKNKKGKVTQIRQYASDFYGNKTKVKTIIL
ncbi:MAG: hypothetical protein LUH11_00920 [Candidatus Gastranaerophilales bacterium]|nr:hypothetical protein [Candidatus Gastranaerophilales bacterium]